ncbi:DUF1700 domain-containing protein [Blautia wexlerae]|nr:DUF1700 domain-containing protein [Blautia wexlerae]
MNRKEFLEILRSQLAGQMQEGKAAAHIRYYEDYIQSQVRGGRSEQEVLQELGDPHLIAKTLIDTDDGSTQEDYGEYSSYGSSYGNETELPHQQEKRWKKVIDLSTWHGRAVVIASSGCYNYFTDTDNRSCDSVFYYSCNYSLFSFMAEEKK